MSPVRFLAAWLLCLSGSVSGQGALWVVDDDGGPGADFTSIAAAIDAADDGDVVLVEDGTYAGFTTIGRSLAVVGAGPGRPFIAGAVTVSEVPSTGWFVLEGLEIQHFGVLVPTSPFRILDCDGPVRVEDCVVVGNILALAQVIRSRSVDLTRCTVRPATPEEFPASYPAEGVELFQSNVSIHESNISATQGFVGSITNEVGAPGLAVRGSSFAYVASSTLTGGTGAAANPNSSIAGQGCIGDNAAGNGGPALLLGTGEPAVVLRDVVLVGGQPGEPNGCGSGATPGPETSVESGTLATASGAPRGYQASTPVVAGSDAELSFRGDPGDFAISLATTNPAFLYLAPYAAPLLVDPLAFPAFLGVVPASGSLELQLPVDPLPPGWGSGVLFLQGVAFDAALAGHVGSPALLVMTTAP